MIFRQSGWSPLPEPSPKVGCSPSFNLKDREAAVKLEEQQAAAEARSGGSSQPGGGSQLGGGGGGGAEGGAGLGALRELGEQPLRVDHLVPNVVRLLHHQPRQHREHPFHWQVTRYTHDMDPWYTPLLYTPDITGVYSVHPWTPVIHPRYRHTHLHQVGVFQLARNPGGERLRALGGRHWQRKGLWVIATTAKNPQRVLLLHNNDDSVIPCPLLTRWVEKIHKFPLNKFFRSMVHRCSHQRSQSLTNTNIDKVYHFTWPHLTHFGVLVFFVRRYFTVSTWRTKIRDWKIPQQEDL